MVMLTDNPVTRQADDRFGFKPYAQILADAIRTTDDLPFCIGVFAEWGAGKSSLMSMIRDDFRDEETIRTIWFNPWKYDRKEDLWNALIQTILFSIAETAGSEDIRTKAKKLARSTAWLMLKKGLGSLSAGLISEKDIDAVTQKIVRQDELYFRHINRFEDDFSKVVSLYTGDGKLVVFIDDLDRCLPENAITVLESLKLFIGEARCVFVLGMDQVVVEQGLNLRFSEKIKMSGRDYLDKIIQVPFYLPPVPFEKLKSALAEAPASAFNDLVWPLIEYGLEGNPRKTKRFINSSFLISRIIQTRTLGDLSGDMEARVDSLPESHQQFYLSKLLIFQIMFSDFYHLLRYHPEAWSIYENDLVRGDARDAGKNVIINFPAIEPHWQDDRLRQFIEKTQGEDFPPTPTQLEIQALIQVINLVSGSGEEVTMSEGPALK